jgi:hypothetical protein
LVHCCVEIADNLCWWELFSVCCYLSWMGQHCELRIEFSSLVGQARAQMGGHRRCSMGCDSQCGDYQW